MVPGWYDQRKITITYQRRDETGLDRVTPFAYILFKGRGEGGGAGGTEMVEEAKEAVVKDKRWWRWW